VEHGPKLSVLLLRATDDGMGEGQGPWSTCRIWACFYFARRAVEWTKAKAKAHVLKQGALTRRVMERADAKAEGVEHTQARRALILLSVGA
jgi:hypothetical protein